MLWVTQFLVFILFRGHVTDNEQSYYIEPTEDGKKHKFYIDPDSRPNVFQSEGNKNCLGRGRDRMVVGFRTICAISA